MTVVVIVDHHPDPALWGDMYIPEGKGGVPFAVENE